MANDENLIPNSERTPSELREITAKGGKKSGEARRRKRDMKAKMKMLLELPPQSCDDFNSASNFGVDIENIDNETVMLIGLFNQAKSGNVNAVKEIRNILGKDNSSAELELKQKEFKMKEQAAKETENNNGQLDKLIEGLKNG